MSIQLLIIILYFALTIAIGIWSSKRSKSSDCFTGSGLGVAMCVAAGTGEWLGGTSTTGVSEYGYQFGISGAWYTVANGIGVLVLAIFFAKLYRSLDTITVPGIIGHFVGGKARTVASVLLIFVMLAVGTSQVVAAGTLGVSLLHLSFGTSVVILGIGFIIYTIAGGMNAVGSTNIMHLIAMYGGVIVALIAINATLDGGLSSLSTSLDTSVYYSPTAIGMPKVSSWIIASVLGACTAQAGIQPILAAKDVHVARRAAFLTAVLVAPFGLFTAIMGMSAKVLFPNLDNAKMALPTLMMSMHPVIGGIVLASIFAAILSTVSPIILAAGTMFTRDIYQKAVPAADDKRLLFIGRASTAVAGVVCIIMAIVMYGSARILDMVYFAYTLRGSLFIVLLYGIYYKKTSERGAIIAMIFTGAIGIFWVTYQSLTGTFPLAPWLTETYAAVCTAAVTTLVFSLMFPNRKLNAEPRQ